MGALLACRSDANTVVWSKRGPITRDAIRIRAALPGSAKRREKAYLGDVCAISGVYFR